MGLESPVVCGSETLHTAEDQLLSLERNSGLRRKTDREMYRKIFINCTCVQKKDYIEIKVMATGDFARDDIRD